MEGTGEYVDFLLRLDDYTVSDINLEQKLSEYNVISRTIIACVKNLEKNLGFFANEKGQPEKSDEDLMREYGEQETVIERSVGTLLKAVATCLVRMKMYVCRANHNCCLGELSKLDYFSKHLCGN